MTAAMVESPLPTEQRTLKVRGPGQVVLTSRSPLPRLEPDEVLVRVAAVALNPYDGKSLDMSPSLGATVGCDFAGTVVALGSAISGPDSIVFQNENDNNNNNSSGSSSNNRENKTPRQLQLGDRVCGVVWGNNPDRLDNGASAEFVAIPASFVFHIPSDMSFIQAATIPMGLATAGLAVHQELGLPVKQEVDGQSDTKGEAATSAPEPEWVLVYGGGTATGTMAIQILRQAGCRPIATCSPRHNARLLQAGAVACFDYQAATCGPAIREHTSDKLKFALDCIANASGASMKMCYEALSSAGGRYVGLDPFPLHVHTRRSVQPSWIFLFTQFGRPVRWERPFNLDARPRDRAFAERWYRVAEQMLLDHHITPPPHQHESGGLAALPDGIDQVHKGLVAGCKLVYSVAAAASG